MYRWTLVVLSTLVLAVNSPAYSQIDSTANDSAPDLPTLGEGSSEPSDTLAITIFYSNDLNGQLFSHGDTEELSGGMASRIHLIQAAMSAGPIVVLDGGDALGPSTLSTWDKGKSMVSLMNLAGYAAMTPGNHEFDFGLDHLSRRKSEAGFPFLAANLSGKGGAETPFEKYVVLDRAGIKIGVVGLVSPKVGGQTNPKLVANLTFGNPAEVARRMVSELTDLGVHYIIALVHMGEEETLSLAREVDGIDLVVAGGFRGLDRAPQVRALSRLVNGVEVVTSPSYGAYLGKVLVRFAGNVSTGYHEIDTSSRLIPITREIPEHLKAASLILELESAYAGASGEALGRIEGESLDDQARLVANLIRSHTKMEVGIVSRGSFREVSADSQMYVRDVDRFVRYDDSLVKLTLTGKQLRKIVSRSKDAGPGEAGLLFAGVDADAMWVNQRPVRDGELYQVATVEYLAVGGGGYAEFTSGENKINTGISLRSLLSAWLKAGSLSAGDFVALDRQRVWRSGWSLEGAFRRNYINNTTALYRSQKERVSFLSGETSIAWNSATRYFLSYEAGPNVVLFENTTDFGQLGESFGDLETSTDRLDGDVTYRRRAKELKVDPFVSTGISTAFSANGGSRPFLWRSSVGFQKRLYRRVVVRFAGRGQRNYTAKETDYGAEISLDYRRRLPQGGRFRSNTKSFFGFTDRKVISVENYNTFSFPLVGKLSLTVRQNNFLYRVDKIQNVPVKGSAVRMDLTVGFAYGLDWKWL